MTSPCYGKVECGGTNSLFTKVYLHSRLTGKLGKPNFPRILLALAELIIISTLPFPGSLQERPFIIHRIQRTQTTKKGFNVRLEKKIALADSTGENHPRTLGSQTEK